MTFFSSDRFWTSIWDPPGFRLGAHLAPRHAETDLPGALGPSKSRFQLCFFGSKSVQERSKRLLRDLQAAKRAPRAVQEAPKSAQRGSQMASKRPPGCQDSSKSSPRGPRIDFRAVLELFGGRFSSRCNTIEAKISPYTPDPVPVPSVPLIATRFKQKSHHTT